MSNSSPTFTVFTPCYNSGLVIERVYKSLLKQEYNDFEWLLIEDCSSDNTLVKLKELSRESPFEMRIHSNKTNQGLTANFDIATKMARGKYFIPLGHDDEISYDTLSYLFTLWKQYKNEEISSIWSQCVDHNGERQGVDFPTDPWISNLYDAFIPYLWKREYFPCIKTALLKNYTFKTTNLRYVPEGLVWFRMAKKFDTIFTNKVTRIYYRDNENSITKSQTREKVAETVVYQFTCWLNEFYAHLEGAYEFKLRLFFGLGLYGSLAKKPLLKILSEVKSIRHKFLIIILFPIAKLKSIRES